MAYTQTDILNAINYSNNRSRLNTVKFLHTQYPHIASHLLVSVRAASYTDDYYFPSNFAHRAIVAEVNIGQVVCEKISCNFATPNGNCTSRSETQYYRIGNKDQFERACQPACFNLMQNKTYDDKGEEIPQMTRLKYHNNNCVFVPESSIWAEMPLFRSTERFETRVNDLPTGFNETQNRFNFSGIGYNYNEPYCQSFFDSFDAANNVCYTKWYEQILNVVVGENIIKMVKSGVIALQNNGNTVPDPNLPQPPPMEEEFKLESWLNDINKDFIVPDPDADLSDFPAQFTTKMFELNKTKLDEIKAQIMVNKSLYAGCKNIENTLRRQIEDGIGKFIPPTTKKINEKKPKKITSLSLRKKKLFDEKKIADEIDFIVKANEDEEEDDGDDEEDEGTNWGDRIQDIFLSILQDMVTNPIFVASIAVDVIITKVLDLIKKQAKNLIERLIPRLTQLLLQIGRPIGERLLSTAIRTAVSSMIVKVALKVVGQMMIALARLVILASSIIGIVLIIISLFDIVLSFWDPLGFNNKYPPGYIDEVMIHSDYALRRDFQMSIPRLEFESFTTLVLTQDEIMTLNIEAFTWVLEYLDVLEINSEGARIDKGDEIEFDILPEVMEDDLNENLAQLRIYTPEEFIEYEQKQSNRWRFSKVMQRLGLVMVGASCLMVALQAQLMAIIFFFFAFALILFSVYSMEIDFVLDNVNQQTFDEIFKYANV